MSETVEQRLTKVEQEIELMKARTESERPKQSWISEVTGSFKNDPEFDEILRLGKEIREADRPANDA
ncbi:MAG: hypothetical protein HQ518_27610 [Rhodopirellula sp.]|nr:hypothetical protein [Rhodopirellula sp.]